ncbi:winged helix DNA-binding domain-containing protein [Tsukamurella sp. 8F]|uniref:winged helix DNA-binding domain-containing protein n=1 Tax=unclassified Tsukamurella TaxID=2633480 RepID=UPI0023B92F26|nr:MULTISPECIES: winged helix DNA-binding domain-containing protein [unclassified Tsukamurella]MDF0532538.1 winged helix DNA-binding domain-containing protein [Tsukamurella sp. 8J]MDF0588108.1 winged helix DNA-binding domain-containing protein [Tsukamurella sp. 8F]
MTATFSPDDVVAYRLRAHGLTSRLDAGETALIDAAGRCGIQNSPPGAALLALHARVRGVTAHGLDTAVGESKALLQTWSMRGAPFYFPTADAPVFTAGVLPPTERSMLHLIRPVARPLAALGLTLTDAVGLVGDQLHTVLAGRRLAIGPLGAELCDRVGDSLAPAQQRMWRSEGAFAPGQPLGEAVVHFCVRILTLQGELCFAPRADGTAPFVLVDEWLGAPIRITAPEMSRAELVRRYLRRYGPSTRADFAAWIGVTAGDAADWWRLVQDDLVPIRFRGTSWMLSEDAHLLGSAPLPTGVRLLPPRDPYTQARDRDTLVDRSHAKQLWMNVGEPGAVLADVRIAGVWRPRKRGARLALTITPFATLSARTRSALEAEAESVAPLRGASGASVSYDD